MISKRGGTVERVNDQLDKVDQMTNGAVDAVDTAVRAVETGKEEAARREERLADELGEQE